jgi:hypothetical protein
MSKAKYIFSKKLKYGKDCQCGRAISGTCTVCPTVSYKVGTVLRIVGNKVLKEMEYLEKIEDDPRETYKKELQRRKYTMRLSKAIRAGFSSIYREPLKDLEV